MSKNPENETVLHQLFSEGITSKEEVDEAMLRYYVYGSTDKVESCDLIKQVMEKNTFKKKFPVAFVYASISHIIKCGPCYEYYKSLASDSKGIEK